MSDNNSSSGGGIGFFGVLFIVFLVLKLTGTIAWSWWWVTAPLWGPFAIIVAVLLVIGILGAISTFGLYVANKKR